VPYPLYLVKLLVRTGLARFLPSVRRLIDGGDACLHYYSDRVLTAPHEALRDVAGWLEVPGADVINLALAAPRFDLVPSGSTKLPADRRGYPPAWGLPELRAAVAGKLLTEHGLAVSPGDEVLVTHGAAGAFSVVLDTFVNPGDGVVLFDPTSPLYWLTLRQRRARVRWLPARVEEGRLLFRLDQLDRSLRRARLLVLNSPANPTGGVLAAEDVEQIAWWADRHDVLLFSDEVFARYQYEGQPATVGVLPRARRRTLTAGSVSKGHALAAARVGWLAGNRHLLRACALTAGVQTPFVPTLCQQIAVTALRQGNDAFAPIRAEFDSRRRYVFERLQAMDLQPPWPAGGFFFWVPVWNLGLNGREFAAGLLREKKVLLTPGEHFGPSGAGFVRLSYAGEEGRVREGLGRLAEFVRELQTGKGMRAQARAA
jgi:aspartate/methionine/tyrosine aminotransferase